MRQRDTRVRIWDGTDEMWCFSLQPSNLCSLVNCSRILRGFANSQQELLRSVV